jgi:hypothetical protein
MEPIETVNRSVFHILLVNDQEGINYDRGGLSHFNVGRPAQVDL